MMTNDQKSKAAALKVAIAASSRGTGGAPREVRAGVVVLLEELRLDGISAITLAGALGINKSTLTRWQRDGSSSSGPAVSGDHSPGRDAGFRMVQVADTKPARAASARVRLQAPTVRRLRVASGSVPAPTDRNLRVAHAPSGLVIDGLDVETLAALLRRMS